MASRRSTYKEPTTHVAAMVERRNEIIDQAPLQASALGVDESDVIEALAQLDSVERARGNAEKAELLYELEMGHINHEIECRQFENVLDTIKDVLKEVSEG